MSSVGCTVPIDDLPIGICFVDRELRVAQINHWLAALATDDCLTRPVVIALPFLGQDLESALHKVISTGEPERNRLVPVTADRVGGPKTLRRSILQVRDEDNRVIGARCIVEDVSEVADALLVLNTVLNDRRMGITVWNQDLELTLTNQAAEEMLEFPSGWLAPGRAFEDCLRFLAGRGEYGQGDSEEQVRVRMELTRRFEAHAFERVTSDGRIFDIRGAPIPSGGFVSTHLDVTEQKQRIRNSEDKYRTYVESSPNAIFVIDATTRIIDANGQSSRLSGYSMEELTGMRLSQLVLDAGEAHQLEEATRTRPFHKELRFHRKTGEAFEVFLNVVSISDERLMATCTDISEHVRLRAEKARLEEHYQQARKMEAIGRLAGGVAHDFNNMLCAIMASAELGLLANRDNDHVHSSLNRIKDASDHAAALTQQLLTFSRRQPIAPKVVDLNEQLATLAPILERLIGEEIRLHIVPHAGRSTIMIAPSQLEQIVINLVVNARDAMESGGDLRISVYEAAESLRPPHLSLAVQDTGCGMSDETKAKIFEPFFTTKEVGKGTGLGLATVFGIIEQHRGVLDVRSAIGEGTIIEASFPLVHEVADVEVSPAVRLRCGAGETILIVEDNAMVRQSTVQMVERLGYSILEAASGADALELSRRHNGRIDMLLTDVVMPMMNGRELAVQMVKERSSIKVLLVSGYADGVVGPGATVDDSIELLPKPFSLAALSARIHAILAKQVSA